MNKCLVTRERWAGREPAEGAGDPQSTKNASTGLEAYYYEPAMIVVKRFFVLLGVF